MMKYLCVKDYYLHDNPETPYIKKGDILVQRPTSRIFELRTNPDITIAEYNIWENKKHFEII